MRVTRAMRVTREHFSPVVYNAGRHALKSRFNAALHEHYGVDLGKQEHHTPDMPQCLRVCDGLFIARCVLKYGLNEGQVEFLTGVGVTRLKQSATRRASDRAANLPVDQEPGRASKDRYTRMVDIDGMKGFCGVSKR